MKKKDKLERRGRKLRGICITTKHLRKRGHHIFSLNRHSLCKIPIPM